MRHTSSRPAKPGMAGEVLVIAFVIMLFGGPVVLHVWGGWRIYFTPIAIWLSLAAAAAGASVFGTWALRTEQQHIDMGTHGRISRGSRRPWRQRLAVRCGFGLVFGAWMNSVLWMVAMATLPPLAEREFRVDATHICKGPRCSDCRHQATTLLRFESRHTTICVDGAQPALAQGERMIVRAYFHPLMIYIDSVRRAPAAPPASTPTSRP